MNGRTESIAYRIGVSATVVSLAALSSAASLYFPLIIAAATAAFLIEGLKSPALAAVSAALAFGVGYLISGFAAGVENFATVAALGAVLALCIRKKAGLFKTAVALGVCAALLTAALSALAVYVRYGSLGEGIGAASRDIYEFARATLKDTLRTADGNYYADNVIEELLSDVTMMLPGIAAALFQLIGAALYFLSKLIYLIFGMRMPKNSEGEYAVPSGAMIFFAVSFLISALLSIIKGADVPRVAAVDLCIALSAPTFLNGTAKLVDRIKRPPVVTMPDGTEMKRPPVFLLGAIVLSLFISPLMPFGIVLAYSVIVTIKKIITDSKKKDG